jgi:hypothetical protein
VCIVTSQMHLSFPLSGLVNSSYLIFNVLQVTDTHSRSPREFHSVLHNMPYTTHTHTHTHTTVLRSGRNINLTNSEEIYLRLPSCNLFIALNGWGNKFPTPAFSFGIHVSALCLTLLCVGINYLSFWGLTKVEIVRVSC